MDGNNVCPFDDFVYTATVLKGNCVPYVCEFPVFKYQEVVVLCKVLKVWY